MTPRLAAGFFIHKCTWAHVYYCKHMPHAHRHTHTNVGASDIIVETIRNLKVCTITARSVFCFDNKRQRQSIKRKRFTGSWHGGNTLRGGNCFVVGKWERKKEGSTFHSFLRGPAPNCLVGSRQAPHDFWCLRIPVYGAFLSYSCHFPPTPPGPPYSNLHALVLYNS